MKHPAKTWASTLNQCIHDTIITDDNPTFVLTSLDDGITRLRKMMQGQMTYMIGNGGSLAIASHLATDFVLAGLKAMALSDAVALTSHANDFGVEAMFTKQLEGLPTRMGDVLIALSCSGRSANIIDAARYAHASGLQVVTLTGFDHDNPLRTLGALNFYVPAHQYGFVQLAHEAVLHAACDIEAWRVNVE